MAIKGFADGMKALEQVYRAYGDIPTVVFGIFPRPKSLPKRIEYIRNPGAETIADRIYNNASLFVSSSWSEGFALPPAEAMACGCAVVATDSGGIREYAEHDVTALLSPARDAGKLAANILFLLRNEDARVRIAKAGNEKIGQLSWDTSANELVKCITSRITGDGYGHL